MNHIKRQLSVKHLDMGLSIPRKFDYLYEKIIRENKDRIISSRLTILEKHSSIEYLTVDHSCTLKEVIAIFSSTRRLLRLTCKNLLGSRLIQVKKLANKPTLTHIFIRRCLLEKYLLS